MSSARYPSTRMCDGTMLELFEPTTRDSDVFVATAAKCGQTWLLTLLHHLRTRGHDPTFGGRGLGAVTPWLELPGELPFGHRIVDRQERLAMFEALDSPRIFKMHVLWEEIPRPASSNSRVITITRDPRDCPYSMFSHLRAIRQDREGSPLTCPESFDDYFEQWMEFGYYFKFVASMWPHRDDPNLLWLRYEQMKRDTRAHCERILAFLGWEATAADIDRVLPLVDFSYMRSQEKTAILPDANDVWKPGHHFFREGGAGKNAARLSGEQSQRIVARVHEELGDECARFVLSLDDPPAEEEGE